VPVVDFGWACGQDPGIGDARNIHITGMGLAGCCLAWQLSFRGVAFTWADDDRPAAASRIAAGLVNPVTGKNFNPSWRLAEFLSEAEGFYARVAASLGGTLWFPLPVWRLVGEREWAKIGAKLEQARPWISSLQDEPGWRAAVVLKGGGRVATREFCEGTRKFFAATERPGGEAGRVVLCEGATGLVDGRLGPHRCAKGEILTLRAPGWRADRILVGSGGWLVPLGGDLFKVGSTYVWDRLDGEATAEGRARVEEIVRQLAGDGFEVVGHEAGVRPIVRQSRPLIGPLDDGRIVFNGLGSKGSLYAPGTAARLADWLIEGAALDPELDLRMR
jgi:glycine/D-amino acid oxidase-like deaminating enzyme